jgi:hypothetical protein
MSKFLDTDARRRRAVYDGQSRLGDIHQSDDGYVARGRRGEVLGTFDTAPAAIAAVLEAGGASS